MDIVIKRVYESADPTDGYRVLVDRLWPRGMHKDELKMDEWAKSLTPSTELRKAWHSGQITDAEFRQRYLAELDGNPAIAELANRARHERVTLLVATRNMATSHALVLAEALRASK